MTIDETKRGIFKDKISKNIFVTEMDLQWENPKTNVKIKKNLSTKPTKEWSTSSFPLKVLFLINLMPFHQKHFRRFANSATNCTFPKKNPY